MKENSREEDIEELKRFLYRDELTQYGKRKLINYYEQQEKDYKRVLEMNEVLLKENEQLKEINEELSENKLLQDIEMKKNFISKQKIKDKIEEILNNKEYRIVFEGDAEFPDDATIINAQKYIKLEKMQELIEEREEK